MSAPSLRPSVLAARQALLDGRQKIRQRHAQGEPGVQVCLASTELLDSVVLELYVAALKDLRQDGPSGLSEQIAIVAHGGFGRRDVAPYSDVDLMILHSPDAAGQVGQLAERLMRDVFDAGLILGHSVRTVEQACSLALEEATICTTLTESRLLTGNSPLYRRFVQRFAQQLSRRVGPLLESIMAARDDERTQFGETVYLLEPNVKRSRGGLRDIQLLRWTGAIAYGAADPDKLRQQGELSQPDQQAMRQALEFLLRLRNEMHFFAGKSNDTLDRGEQVRIAEVFGYTGAEGRLPVEQFMQDYFLHTDAVSHIVSRFVANARPGSRIKKFLNHMLSRRQDGDYFVGPTEISSTRQGRLRLQGNLEEILRLADLANHSDKNIAHETCEAIRASADEIDAEISPAAAARFLSLLSPPARLGDLLRFLHEMRVLEKIIPAFEHARCLLQFNEYHKYTVDEHCLRAVERATAFMQDDGPCGRVYRRLKNKRVLHLALLIHDLGKGFVEDHSELGAKIAEQTASRLRMPPRESRQLRFLVHKHLMMSHLAFRRDTSDEQLVVRFAIEVGSPENLDMLFVLTCADMAAVGPGVLNSWKIEVLADLHARGMQHLAGESGEPQRRLRELPQAIRQQLGTVDDPSWFDRQIAALPPAYASSRTVEQIATELAELRRLQPGQVNAHGNYRVETQTVEFTVATNESIAPGVFHRLTGALSGKGLQIISAEINTLAEGLILDRFWVCDPDSADKPAPGRIEQITVALQAALTTAADTPPQFRRLWNSGGSQSADLPRLPTQVRIDNSTSDRCTIIDIFTADRRGLLYTITRKLFDLGLSVSVAKIGTYLDQVVDVFYVTDREGEKIENDDQLEQIRSRLLEEIESFSQQTLDQMAAR
ncbi:MAG: [protein-PII] uridylyltransferase [Pirellulales bacterium]